MDGSIFFAGLQKTKPSDPHQWMTGNTAMPFRDCVYDDCLEWDFTCQNAVATPSVQGVFYRSVGPKQKGDFCILWSDNVTVDFYIGHQVSHLRHTAVKNQNPE